MAIAPEPGIQRIARLTPLGSVLKLIEGVSPARPERCRLAQACGYTLAEDAIASLRPASPIALRDGFAVQAAMAADAGPYAPVRLASPPPRVDAGDRLPDGTDAVVAFDAVVLRGDGAELIAAAAPGEGVLPSGADARPDAPLRRAGQRLRATDIAAMAALGIAEAAIRAPRIRIGCGGARTPIIDAALDLLVRVVALAGGRAIDAQGDSLERMLAGDGADAVIAVGGTGSGRGDASVRVLAQHGRVGVHGIAASPGETTAFGFAGTKPVLLVPGRLDAALAVWLLVGRHLIARLSGGRIHDLPATLPLARKAASAIGLTELVPVACAGGMAEPLAASYLSFAALIRSDGWIVIPADSEGFAAGTPVAVRPWP